MKTYRTFLQKIGLNWLQCRLDLHRLRQRRKLVKVLDYKHRQDELEKLKRPKPWERTND